MCSVSRFLRDSRSRLASFIHPSGKDVTVNSFFVFMYKLGLWIVAVGLVGFILRDFNDKCHHSV
jgi:hypothetical protein